jgi:hypothetical protein
VIELNSTAIANQREHPVYLGSEVSFRARWFGVGGGMFGGPLLGTMLGGFGRWVEDEGHDGLHSDNDQDGGSTEWSRPRASACR